VVDVEQLWRYCVFDFSQEFDGDFIH
jgi:hypothetical protein